MHYERNDVIIAFRARNADENRPSEARLENFDEGLFDLYDAHIRQEAPGHRIALTPFNVSKLALLALLSSGTPALQVRFACRYFASVGPQPPPAGPVIVAELVPDDPEPPHPSESSGIDAPADEV